jgi:hypothetical protein
MEEYQQGDQSLSHSTWDCKYHVVFIPKKRRRAFFWTSPTPFREDLSCLGAAERMPDFGRPFASGSGSYVYRDFPEAPGRFGDRLSQREERHCRGSGVLRKGSQFHRGALSLLSSGIRGIHCWL